MYLNTVSANCTCNADPAPNYTLIEQHQYNGKCYSLYDSYSAIGRIGHPTAQQYCVSKSIGGNYGQLVTFATWIDYETVTSLFANYPSSANGRAVHIGLQIENNTTPTWEDPHHVCGAEPFPIGSGPSSCASWTHNTNGTSYVIAYHSWCDWEVAPITDGGFSAGCCRWLICEFGS